MTTPENTTPENTVGNHNRNPAWLAQYHRPENKERNKADLERRLRAAGIDPDDDASDGDAPKDMDKFRHYIARSIYMFLNDWPGCPEPLCQRQRGCMTPQGYCTNTPPKPDTEELRAEWEEAKADIWRALKESLAAQGYKG